jgi:hypothetical protein
VLVMQSSCKIAMKERTRRWSVAAGAFSPAEQLNNAEYFAYKATYLEDMVRLYQQELEFHMITKKAQGRSGVGGGALGMGVTDSELSRMSENSVGMARQVRILNDEIGALRKEKEIAVGACTADFHKAIQRNTERHSQVNRTMLQENEVLRSKISSLEAEQREKKSLEGANHAVEIMDLRYRIEELEGQLGETENDVEQERTMRVGLEEALVDARQELFDMEIFVAGFDRVAEDIFSQIGRQRLHHGQLVNTLLQSSALASGAKGDITEEMMEGMQRTDNELAELEMANVGDNPTMRLQAMLKKLETISEAQQVELALAVRCAIDGFDSALKASAAKLNNSYAHCELQVQRIEDLERQFAEQRDHAFSERDKAMNQRDQALLQLRSRQDTKDHRFLKHVEVQTVVRGDFGTVLR